MRQANPPPDCPVCMFADLMPGWIRVEEATDKDWDSPALPAERRSVDAAIDGRMREFAAGRSCARRALQNLGIHPAPILVGPQRQPVWPHVAVGSITHTAGFCAAAVASRKHLCGLGIDAEKNRQLPGAIRDYVMVAEDVLVGDLRDVDLGTLAFSAKEAFFKAWFPQTARWLEFTDVAVAIDALRKTFTVSLTRDESDLVPPEAFFGRWAASKDHVFTASWAPVDFM